MRLILLLILITAFSVPIFKMVFRVFLGLLFFLDRPRFQKLPIFLRKIINALSAFEYYFASVRGLVAGLFLFLAFGHQLFVFSQAENLSRDIFVNFAVLLFFMALHWATRVAKVRADVRVMEFLRTYPRLKPDAFWSRFMRERAFAYGDLDVAPGADEMVLPQSANFSEQTRARFSRFGVWLGFWDAMQMAKMALRTLQNVGQRYFYENTDLISVMIAKRLLHICRADFQVSGLEKLEGLRGKFIFVFNHESALDFMLAPFALSEIVINGRHARPRFFMAREHFRNVFVYNFLGIGKAAEALDMIFINRKNARQSHNSMKQAAQAVVAKDIDLAIFPQGTRALASLDRAGKRRDAGYYTTITRKTLQQNPPHLKKGVAHLVLDILQEFSSQGRDDTLYLVFGGIEGAAKVLPRGRWSLETESKISFRFGDVLAFHKSMLTDIFPGGSDANPESGARKAFVNKLMRHIDQKFVEVLDLPQKLSKRFFMDLKGQFRHYDNEKLAQLDHALKQAYGNGEPVYALLDCLYALPVKDWNGYLSQFCQLLLGKPEPKRFESLLAEVMQKLVQR